MILTGWMIIFPTTNSVRTLMQWRDAALCLQNDHTRPTASPSATLLWLFTNNLKPMNTKHTPAPWSVDPHTAHVNEISTGLPLVAMQWPSDDRSEEETKANANLIAAAPDLLAACQHVIDTHGHHAQDCCKCEDCEYLRPISDAIKKAIPHNTKGDAPGAIEQP